MVEGRRDARTTAGPLDGNTVAFSQDDQTLIAVKGSRKLGHNGWDFEATAWDLVANAKKTSFKASMNGGMHAVAMSPGDKYLLAIMFDATIEVWDLRTGSRRELQPSSIEPSMEIDESNLSPKGSLYITYRRLPEAEGVVLRDWWTRRTIASFEGQKLGVFSPDGRVLATAGIDNSLTLWIISGVR